MTNFNWVFPALMLIFGVFLMFWTLRFNRNLFNGQATQLWKYVLGSALYGLWVFLVSVGGILVAGSIYESYGWTTHETIGIAVLGLIAGVLATIGALWQFFIATKLRDNIYQLLVRKDKKK